MVVSRIPWAGFSLLALIKIKKLACVGAFKELNKPRVGIDIA